MSRATSRRARSILPFTPTPEATLATAEILTVHLDAHERPTMIVLECDGPLELLAKIRVRRFELTVRPPG